MNTRIRKLRKFLDLTQREFGDRIGIKANTVTMIEKGRNTSEQTIQAICREFRVNEEWLRTGNGDMFKAAPADALDALIEQYGLPHEIRILAEKFMALKPDAQEVVINYVRDVAAAISAENPSAAPTDQHAAWEAEARAEAEQVYREVLAEKRAEAGLSASPSGSAEGAKGA